MKKHIITLVLVIFALIIMVLGFRTLREFNAMKKLENRGVGKNICIIIEQGQLADYNYLASETVLLWREDEREKVYQFMKDNNFRLVSGKYIINQTTTYDEALKIFKFEKIE